MNTATALPSDTHLTTCPLVCPNCSHSLTLTFPVEPLYDLAIAAQLIPCTLYTLKELLNRRKEEFPRRYRKYKVGCQTRLYRMLTASEIMTLRVERTVYRNPDKTPRQPNTHGA